MEDEVFMDIPAVRKIAKTFDTISDVLKKVCKGLEVVVMILKASAFFGMVGNLAVVRFIEMVKPYIEKMAQKCDELCKDVNAAVEAFERGDKAGSLRFH
jgi:uncharacterized protein Yka (UPF0111/DUF47 family)